jgi:hypothetical protein
MVQNQNNLQRRIKIMEKIQARKKNSCTCKTVIGKFEDCMVRNFCSKNMHEDCFDSAMQSAFNFLSAARS